MKKHEARLRAATEELGASFQGYKDGMPPTPVLCQFSTRSF